MILTMLTGRRLDDMGSAPAGRTRATMGYAGREGRGILNLALNQSRNRHYDGIDNVAMIINLDGPASVTQGATLNGFDGVALLHAAPAAMTRSNGMRMALMITRHAMSPAVADVQRATMQLIPTGMRRSDCW